MVQSCREKFNLKYFRFDGSAAGHVHVVVVVVVIVIVVAESFFLQSWSPDTACLQGPFSPEIMLIYY